MSTAASRAGAAPGEGGEAVTEATRAAPAGNDVSVVDSTAGAEQSAQAGSSCGAHVSSKAAAATAGEATIITPSEANTPPAWSLDRRPAREPRAEYARDSEADEEESDADVRGGISSKSGAAAAVARGNDCSGVMGGNRRRRRWRRNRERVAGGPERGLAKKDVQRRVHR